MVACSPQSPGLSHGELAISVIFGLPLLSRVSLKLTQAVLFVSAASRKLPSGFAVLTR